MRFWKLLIVLGSAGCALAVGLGAQAQPEHANLAALVSHALNAIT
jgi:hypothetical protein